MNVLVMLASLSEATPRALAQACGIDTQRLRWIMEGHEGVYSEDLALIPLGLAEIREIRGRKVYAITDAGRRKARQLTARKARRAIAREANARRVPVAMPGAPRPGVATPDADG
jgi:predicted transcriptional regulator with HTH domain